MNIVTGEKQRERPGREKAENRAKKLSSSFYQPAGGDTVTRQQQENSSNTRSGNFSMDRSFRTTTQSNLRRVNVKSEKDPGNMTQSWIRTTANTDLFRQQNQESQIEKITNVGQSNESPKFTKNFLEEMNRKRELQK